MNPISCVKERLESPCEKPSESTGSDQVPYRPSGRQHKGRVSSIERALLRRLLKATGSPPVSLVLWNGEEFADPGTAASSSIHIHDRRTLWKLALDPLYEFGEAYVTGRLVVEGNLPELLTILFRLLSKASAKGSVMDRFSAWFHRPRGTTLTGSRQNIHHHYDIGNDFYELWLDKELVYTCAYFADLQWSLEQAQRAKMDHVCRKVRLRPGETVFEAGCGWGALALYMARRYGARVRAFNISHEQIVYARERALREGLADQVEFIEDDWRNINGRCDAFVSVGMLEHVGKSNYVHLGEVIRRCLPVQGRGLIHTIGQRWPRPLNPWIERRVFPGAYPPALSELTQVFEPHGFSVLDLENLRLHYAETLRHWLRRFERSRDVVREMFDERFVRTWQLYLSGSIAAFESGGLQLYQIVFAHGVNNDVPRTRAGLYAAKPEVDSEPAMARSEAISRQPR